MKFIITLILGLGALGAMNAQNLNKTIDIGTSKSIAITSDYPSVEIHTSDGSDLVIEGYVLGNGMPLNDVVEVVWNSANSSLDFRTDIDLAKQKTKDAEPKNLDNLSKEELKKIIQTRRGDSDGEGHHYYDGKQNWNLETHIVIYLPATIKSVEADMTYGKLEMDHLATDVKIFNRYGTIDVESKMPMKSCELESTYATVSLHTPNDVPTDYRLQSNYGEIFTDVDLKVDTGESTQKAFKTIIIGSYKSGGRQSIKMRSDYSNVYLRNL